MPASLRPNKKATKIAWDILGKPANIQFDKSAFSEKVEQTLKSNHIYGTIRK